MLKNNGFHNRHSPFSRPFSPASFFANGEQGWWYDPSNFSTLFQDSAGTAPVTAVEQPVGLQLDLSQGGVGSNGAARYNLLTKTEDFGNAVWTKTNMVAANTTDTTDPLGGNTADKLLDAAGTGFHSLEWRGNASVSQVSDNFTFSVALKQNGRPTVFLGCYQNGGSFPSFSAEFTFSTESYTSFSSGTGVFVSASIVTLGNGWYRCTVTGRTGAASSNNFQLAYSGASYAGDITKGYYIWGADLRLASQAALTPTYQPIDTSWTASIPGNHRFQSTSANRPVVSARVNLLERTEDFTNAYWTKDNCTVTGNTTIAPDGTATGDTCTVNTVAGARYVRRNSTLAAGSYTFTYAFKYSGSQQYVSLTLYDTTYKGCVFDVQNGTVTFSQSATGSVVSLGNGWYRCTIVATVAAGTVFYDANLTNSSTAIAPGYLGNGTDNVFIWGADLRVTNQGVGLPAYQRVNTSTDYDSTGFPVYIKPNGSNQFMQTNSINFTATDKMTVWQGVRKISAATAQTMELSINVAANSGSFSMPSNAGTGNWLFASRGSGTAATAESATDSYIAPITTVNTGIADISGDVVTLRVNGVQAATSSADQGTGNYGNWPAYFYARGGTTLYSSNHDYGSIARGAASTAAQITAGETYINSKTKAF